MRKKGSAYFLASLLVILMIITQATALAKVELEGCELTATIIKANAPLKNENGKTIIKLKKGDTIGVDAIHDNTYYVNYRGAFYTLAASYAAVEYDIDYDGTALRKTYGYSKMSTSSKYRDERYAKGDALAICGRSGNFYMQYMGEGTYIYIPVKDVNVVTEVTTPDGG